jgi:hypothetical protein
MDNLVIDKIVIDNCVVSSFPNNGIRIRTIKLERKMNSDLNIEELQKISFGSKKEDNRVISLLCDGVWNFEDLKLKLTNN